MNKQCIEHLTENNKAVIVSTNAGTLIGVITNIEEAYIQIKVSNISFVTTDNISHFEDALIPINQIISICTISVAGHDLS